MCHRLVPLLFAMILKININVLYNTTVISGPLNLTTFRAALVHSTVCIAPPVCDRQTELQFEQRFVTSDSTMSHQSVCVFAWQHATLYPEVPGEYVRQHYRLFDLNT